jgi:isopentenyl diphosphate isomerase/L-lactate dehydrogenase-like FMN-dependent dehydrogenase
MNDILNMHDFEARARQVLDAGALAYLDGGALDEITLAENVASWRRRRFRPRVLRDVSAVDATTTLLGRHVQMPIGIAPTAQHRLFHPDAELATARAAADAGVVFTASTASSLPMEEIAVAGGSRWFQLYIQRDQAVSAGLVNRAVAAGYEALVVTVDLPVMGRRERDLRPGFAPPQHDYGNLNASAHGDNLEATLGRLVDPGITWDDIARLRRETPLPVVLKGILTGEDAELAVECGAAAVWVSNHGARQLDRTPAPLDVLEEVVAAVRGRAEVYVDGGARRGADAAIALALGADAVFLGRPLIYALAVSGEDGVRQALSLLHAEFVSAMSLLGAATVADITRQMVV